MEEILVDEKGYKQFFAELERLKDLSITSASKGNEAYSDAVGDGWHDNFAFEESMRESRAIAKKIDEMLQIEKKLKLITDDKKNDNIINIGDTVTIEINYGQDDIEKETITLTGNFIPDTNKQINEISLNSPLGKALFKKEIGTFTTYFVGENKIIVNILNKMMPNA